MWLPVLTPEEKRVVIFVLAAFVLGLGTKYYRTNHSPSSLPNDMTQLEFPTQRDSPDLAGTTAPAKKKKKAKEATRETRATPSPGANETR